LQLRLGAGPQQISIDSCCCGATRRPRKFWSDCKEVHHTCFGCFLVNINLDLILSELLAVGLRVSCRAVARILVRGGVEN